MPFEKIGEEIPAEPSLPLCARHLGGAKPPEINDAGAGTVGHQTQIVDADGLALQIHGSKDARHLPLLLVDIRRTAGHPARGPYAAQ